jgi:hypothetical protein
MACDICGEPQFVYCQSMSRAKEYCSRECYRKAIENGTCDYQRWLTDPAYRASADAAAVAVGKRNRGT